MNSVMPGSSFFCSHRVGNTAENRVKIGVSGLEKMIWRRRFNDFTKNFQKFKV